MTTDQETKVRENRLRRAAQRQGLALTKSRTRDPRALGYGLYALADDKQDRDELAKAFTRGEGLTLDEVEDRLNW